jgi:glutaredoxin 3
MIQLYSTPTCGFCHMAKEYFDSLHVAYEEHDITTDEAGLKWVLDNTGMAAVPVLDIDGTVIVGFDKKKIDAALATHKS